MDRIDVCGVPFFNTTVDGAVDEAMRLIATGKPGYVVTPNAEIMQEALENDDVKTVLLGASIVLPDGIGVVKAASILGRPLKGKVAGIEFGEALAERFAKTGNRLYLFGGKPGIAEMAAQKLIEKHPGLNICGTADGYFKDDSERLPDILKKKPDALFVCLGAPKQELWMSKHVNDLNGTLMVGLGGSLDGYAGVVKRAPKIFVKLGLEWFYRLICQPWRLGRMMRLPKFLVSAKKYAKAEKRSNCPGSRKEKRK